MIRSVSNEKHDTKDTYIHKYTRFEYKKGFFSVLAGKNNKQSVAPLFPALERKRSKDGGGLHMLWRVSFVNSSYALACLHVNMIYFPSLPRSS